MDDRMVALARNVRRLRTLRGLSLKQLAERSGVTTATLFRIESQRGNPTLETMLALCDAFSVPISDMLASADASECEVVRAGGGGELMDSAIDSRLVKSMMVGSTLFEIYDNTIRPGQTEVSLSHGPGAREHVLVRSGRVKVGPLESQETLSADDYATYPSDRPHSWSTVGNRAARIWVLHTFPRPASARAPEALTQAAEG